MKIEVKYLQAMMDKLVQKHSTTYETKALETLSEEIEGLSDGYLYKKVVNPMSKMKANDTLGLRDAKVNAIIKHLGYKNIKAFKLSIDEPIPKQLLSLTGYYYSYIRRNTKEGVLLRSPVSIKIEDSQVVFIQKGGRQTFKGEVKLKQGCLFVLLRGEDEKSFHHIYKIGAMEKPNVLQGVFSGVTSAFDPIGGRVVLVRREEGLAKLETGEIDLKVLKKSKLADERTLAHYFERYEDNNLRINKVGIWGFGDLE